MRHEAIRKIHPEVVFVDGDLSAYAEGGTQVTLDEAKIQAEITRLQAIYDSTQYQRDRATEYPHITDQLDMLYWDKINETEIWKNSITKIKEKFPKE